MLSLGPLQASKMGPFEEIFGSFTCYLLSQGVTCYVLSEFLFILRGLGHILSMRLMSIASKV